MVESAFVARTLLYLCHQFNYTRKTNAHLCLLISTFEIIINLTALKLSAFVCSLQLYRNAVILFRIISRSTWFHSFSPTPILNGSLFLTVFVSLPPHPVDNWKHGLFIRIICRFSHAIQYWKAVKQAELGGDGGKSARRLGKRQKRILFICRRYVIVTLFYCWQTGRERGRGLQTQNHKIWITRRDIQFLFFLLFCFKLLS